MDNIGKMYNSSGHSSSSGYPYARESVPRQIPSHTENFYRTLREASPQPKKAEPVEQKPTPSPSSGEARQTGGILSSLGLSGGNPLGGLGSLGGSLGSSLSSLMKKIGDDDILLLLMIVLLLNENKQDDYLILIILAVILLT